MKKVIVLIAVFTATSICFAQTDVIEKHGNTMIEGRSFITDAGVYNSYDLFGSPLGLLELDSSRVTVSAGYGYAGIGDIRGHYLGGQTVRMGEPGKAFFEIFYGPDILSAGYDTFACLGLNCVAPIASASLTLHRFGLALAGMSESGSFGAALLADGYIGSQKWAGIYDTRAIMGFKKLRLDMGSQPHELLRIGFYFGVTGGIDTLYSTTQNMVTPTHEDRSGQLNLPEIGFNINFGGGDMPVRSNFSVEHAWSRFVYTSKEGFHNRYGVDGLGNEYAIVNDSLRLFWLTHAAIPVEEELGLYIKPGLLLGYTRNAGRMHYPDSDNNPLKLGHLINGSEYTLSGFHFGGGAKFQASGYAGVFVEYMGAAMSLNLDNANAYDIYGNPPPLVSSRMLHHTVFGVSTHLHDHLTLPLEITKRIAYFNSGSSGIIPPRHSSVEPMNIVPIGFSKIRHYNPGYFLDGFQRTSGVTFGVDGQGLDGMLSTSIWMSFLTIKRGIYKDGGLEFGASVEVSL